MSHVETRHDLIKGTHSHDSSLYILTASAVLDDLPRVTLLEIISYLCDTAGQYTRLSIKGLVIAPEVHSGVTS